MEINIREATLTDTTLLGDLLMTVHELHRQEMPKRYRSVRPNDPDVLAFFEAKVTTQGNTIFIAEVEGEAIGYIICEFRLIPDHVLVFGCRNLHIDQMSVNRSYEGQGVGRALMVRVLELAKTLDVERVTLGVVPFNERAIKFYKRFGFEISTHRMTLNLSD